MKILKSTRRSVSPFGTRPVEKDAFDDLLSVIQDRCPDLKPQESATPVLFQDFYLVPALMRRVAEAPAKDAPELKVLCDYLLKHALEITAAGLFDEMFSAMKFIFNRKTEIFMIDHHDKTHCEKMGWTDEYRDMVLFSDERDILVGGYFEPATREKPGHFSEFFREWSETENLDRALHFLDFSAKLSRSTFDFYLLGSHAAISRITRNKEIIRSLFQKCQPLVKKAKSPTWEKDTRAALGI